MNNVFLCGLLLGSTDEDLAKRAAEKMSDPFIGYNTNVFTQTPGQLKALALFETIGFQVEERTLS